MAARPRSALERRAAAEARRARRAHVEDADVVMAAAASFLAVRPRSVAETRQRLRGLGYPQRLCDQVVARLTELGYLDDVAFASAWVSSRDRARPRGEAALRRELAGHGLPREIVDAVLAGRRSGVVGDLAAARRLVERRSASLLRVADPGRRRQRAYALLARNGFDPDVCRDVAATLGDLDEDEGRQGV